MGCLVITRSGRPWRHRPARHGRCWGTSSATGSVSATPGTTSASAAEAHRPASHETESFCYFWRSRTRPSTRYCRGLCCCRREATGFFLSSSSWLATAAVVTVAVPVAANAGARQRRPCSPPGPWWARWAAWRCWWRGPCNHKQHGPRSRLFLVPTGEAQPSPKHLVLGRLQLAVVRGPILIML